MAIGRHGAADFRDDVFVAVAVEVGERDAVALVQFAGAGRAVTSDEGLPSWFRSSTCGSSDANDGFPMPR